MDRHLGIVLNRNRNNSRIRDITWRYYVTRAFEKILSFQPFCIEQVFNKVGMAFCPMHSRLYMMFLNSIPRLHNTPGHGVESRVHTNKELILAISGY